MKTAPRLLRKIWPLALLLLTACGGGGSSATSGYSVGGTVSGLSGSVVLQNNSADSHTVSVSGPFTFPVPVAAGSTYNVTIQTQPDGQTCSLSNGSGTISGQVGNVAVTCVSRWVWRSGSSVVDQNGVYGTQGVAAPNNVPGSRQNSVSWTDNSGNLWLFGGYGLDSAGGWGQLNDLWKFDGANWTWVSGSHAASQAGSYGTQGIAAATNIPGARIYAVTWTDNSGKLWLFGGRGFDAAGTYGYLNDLWQFDGSCWIWMGGNDTVNASGIYGIQGLTAAGNTPGARELATTWVDSSGHLMLFGGYGADFAGAGGFLNDLWQFDGMQWTWVSGSNVADASGNYGTQGVTVAGNLPSARESANGWTDASGNLWLFGGSGTDAVGASGSLNDLWKYDGAQWTWVSGANLINQSGVYGTQGVAASGNAPGARVNSASWTDSSGNLWLFGGVGYDSVGSADKLNDLWKFDGTQWTWVNGSNAINQVGVYGARGEAAANNVLGARESAVSWTDSNGRFWLFGGYGVDSNFGGDFNDLWSFQP